MPHVAARRALIGLVLAGTALAAQGEVYKWKDEKGVTHYSETPPPDAKASKLELPRDAAPPPAPPPPNWTQREVDFRKRQVEQGEAGTKSEQQEAQRKQRCLAARERLGVLRAQVPVFRLNERGERIYLEDRDREEQLTIWQRRADENCR